MSVAVAEEPRLLHALPGRMRVHLPEWGGQNQRKIESALRKLPGVQSVQANPLTGNILIAYDQAAATQHTLLDALRGLYTSAASARAHPAGEETSAEEGAAPVGTLQKLHVIQEKHGQRRRARIAIKGLDRQPYLAKQVVERLERHPGVKAQASPLTGRVLVEFSEDELKLQDLISDIVDMDLPDLPEDDEPKHPLDPAPLFQSATRTIGATLGLSVFAVRRALGRQGPVIESAAFSNSTAIISILTGFPFIRNGLRRLLGRDAADLVMTAPALVSLTLSNNPLGLLVTGAEALRLLTEVVERRAAWRRYEERISSNVAAAQPGAVLRLEPGEHVPLACTVIEGQGTATGCDGLPQSIEPGSTVSAGAKVYGGPFVVELEVPKPFAPSERPERVGKSFYERYILGIGPASLGFALGTAIFSRSWSRTLEALLLVNPRTAVIGKESADLGAAARVLSAGVTVVGTRQNRHIQLPDLLLFDGPRLLTDRFELSSTLPLSEAYEPSEILTRAATVAAAAGSPWGRAFPTVTHLAATDGHFSHKIARATIGGVTYTLGPVHKHDDLPAAARLRHRGDYLLVLRSEQEEQPLGILALRPRLAPGAQELVQACKRYGVDVRMLSIGSNPVTAQAIANRTGVQILPADDTVQAIRNKQAEGGRVAFVSDNAHAAEAFSACDLAIGLSAGRTYLAARADLIVNDLNGITAIIEAGAQREKAVRDSTLLSMLSNGIGIYLGTQGERGVQNASLTVYGTALAALGIGWARLRGGERPRTLLTGLVDPHPERWGRRSIPATLSTLGTSETGLTIAQAAERRQVTPSFANQSTLMRAILDQLRSPLTVILGFGAAVSLTLGAVADMGIIGATIAANVGIGAWQEHRAGQVAQTLEQMGTSSTRVLRDGQPVAVPSTEIVPGDALLLTSGDRIVADARVIESQNLEVDEAALTGESLPVRKSPEATSIANRIVLAGTDVTTGNGRAIAVAVGRNTRMGATAAALSLESTKESPLGTRLSRLLRQTVPLALAGGAIVTGMGFLRTRTLLPQLAVGGSIALAAVPEGLPLLASMGEAAVARRLATRHALVRRLSSVETLGRVDVVGTDKTGTLTEGRLALRLVVSLENETVFPGPLNEELRQVLLAAALASPHPDAAGAAAHPTDVAVIKGAEEAGLGEVIRAPRLEESLFDPARSFHAALTEGQLYAKGAPEALVGRCSTVLRQGGPEPLDEDGRRELLETAQRLAERGLRVLLVAVGPASISVKHPRELMALGFVGINDPLRPNVRAAVQRCHEAGVRVIMLTGDHPATARTIAREAGLLGPGDEVLTGADLAELQNGELDERLAHANVIARATPLDKVRIVESLRRQGHTVAMTGDGVNDAPALRLADVGIAMGRAGTEVARQTADVILTTDDFAELVETFVEGRSFWRNIRRALGLLIGGNLGELGLLVGTSVLGFPTPMTARQILAVNLVTDVLPGLAVALQQPEHRNLAGLAREGTSALDTSLRRDFLRRATATATPALAAYILATRAGLAPQAQTVAFASIVANQLAQTLDAGWTEGTLSASVLGAVGGSVGLMLTAMTVPPLQTFLGLALPTPFGWVLIGGGALVAVALGRVLAGPELGSQRLALPPASSSAEFSDEKSGKLDNGQGKVDYASSNL